jgi:phospholipid-transporting ATPase
MASTPPPPQRSLLVGVPAMDGQYPSNAVKTAVYTAYNFLPKNLFKQFTRFSNLYFLFITVLQLLPDVTSSNGVPTMVLPLAFIMFVSGVRDAMEDVERHRADRLQNDAPVHKLHFPAPPPSSAHALTFAADVCSNLRVGELVRVTQNEEIPVDMVPIASSAAGSGQCFVMTANLDGESSLKPRYVPSALCSEPYTACFSSDGQNAKAVALMHLPATRVVCEPPSGRIDKFRGEIVFPDDSSAILDIANVLFRGTHLKDTAWVIGVVVYTGSDTRVQQNASETPLKRSWLYAFINRVTLYIVLVQIVILVVAVLVQKSLVSAASVQNNPFIPDDTKNADALDYVWLFLAYMLLFSNFVPISLQVTVDFTRYFQARVIALDCEALPYAPTRLVSASAVLVDTAGSNSKRLAVRVQSSELNEELGLVQHVFSDKTGTLTCNKMEFCSCHVDGRTYDYEEDGSLHAVDVAQSPAPSKGSRPSVSNGNPAKITQVHKFLLNLAVNNYIFPSVVAVGGEGASMSKTEYSGPSPDERALVLAAARAGVALRYRDSTHIVVRVQDEDVAMDVLHVFEFSSERKKSSILVRDPAGRLQLLVKGADSVVLDALSAANNSPSRILMAREQMKVYSSNGLRVLCIAEREVGFDEYRAWLTRYNGLSAKLKDSTSSSQVEDTEHAMDVLVTELESQLTFIGVSAIEDKIQDGAPETLQKLREAGVKVWMLTGDRPDTATNVAHSVRLVTSEMKLIRLCDAKALSEGREAAETHLVREIRDAADYQRSQEAKHAPVSLGLLLDDHVVDAIFQFGLERELLDLCLLCESVLCARVSPKQKELIVQMVRRLRPHQVTLAIGDGANDVPMIQRAHIGVGIAGEEGHQAADASDYSLPSFQYLQRLVLVHGRAMNRRIAVLTLYIFYKNVLLVLPQFFFGAYCLYSGQSTYFDTLLQLFNICFTALPVLYFAVTDEDISPATVLSKPRLYADGYRHEFLNLRLFAAWMLEAVVASVLIIIIPAELLPLAPWSGQGKDNDLWAMGTAQNFMVVFLANARLLLEVSSGLKRMTQLAAASVMCWWLVTFVLSSAVAFGREFYGILRVGEISTLVLLTMFCSAASLSLAFSGRVWRVLFAPLPRTIHRELDFMSGFRAARSVDAIFPIDRDEDAARTVHKTTGPL